MAAVASYTGFVKIATNVIALVQDANLDLMAETYDTTSLGGSGWKTFIPGLLSGKLPLKMSYDQTDTNGQAILQTNYFNRTKIASVVYSPDGVKTYTFAAWVASFKIMSKVNGKVEADVELMPDGAITAA
jgi:hypothetical protein